MDGLYRLVFFFFPAEVVFYQAVEAAAQIDFGSISPISLLAFAFAIIIVKQFLILNTDIYKARPELVRNAQHGLLVARSGIENIVQQSKISADFRFYAANHHSLAIRKL